MNPNCDGGHCLSEAGEVRILPVSTQPGSRSNAYFCKPCYEHEIRWRKERNRGLGHDNQFALPTWESLEKKE